MAVELIPDDVTEFMDAEEAPDEVVGTFELPVAVAEDEEEGVASGSKTSTPRLWTLIVGDTSLEVAVTVVEDAIAFVELDRGAVVVATELEGVSIAEAGENVTVDETPSELLSTAVDEMVGEAYVEENVIVVETTSELVFVSVALVKLEVEVAEGMEDEEEPANRSSEAA